MGPTLFRCAIVLVQPKRTLRFISFMLFIDLFYLSACFFLRFFQLSWVLVPHDGCKTLFDFNQNVCIQYYTRKSFNFWCWSAEFFLAVWFSNWNWIPCWGALFFPSLDETECLIYKKSQGILDLSLCTWRLAGGSRRHSFAAPSCLYNQNGLLVSFHLFFYKSFLLDCFFWGFFNF